MGVDIKTPKPAWLLVADDDEIILKLISIHCDKANIRTQSFASGEELLLAINEDTRVCLLDLQMGGISGLDCLQIIKEKFPSIEVIIATTLNNAEDAVKAMKGGAFDYLTKPLEPVELIHTIRNAYRMSEGKQKARDLLDSFSTPSTGVEILGKSASMKVVLMLVERIAKTDNVVVLTGESGTGKTLIARKIHEESHRRDGPFISVSCPSLPRDLLESEMFGHEQGAFSGATRKRLGRVELAHGGTLFLDEIGELPLDIQAKLLTFLQDKAYYRIGGEKSLNSDVRVIVATNRDLLKMVKEGLFREDLYYRLNVLPICMPSLIDRREDIPLLVDHFIFKLSTKEKIPPVIVDSDCMEFLSSLPWVGNVRELENVLIRAFTLRGDPAQIKREDLVFLKMKSSPVEEDISSAPSRSLAGSLGGQKLADIEKEAIKQTLLLCRGSKSDAAQTLGISEKSVYNKIKKYHIVD